MSIMLISLAFLACVQDARVQIPEDAEIKKAEAVIKAALSKEYAGAVSRTARRDLSRKLVAQSDGTKDNAERYVLLRDAIENATAGGDYPWAFRTIDVLAGAFRVTADDLKVSTIAKAKKGPLTPEDAIFLSETCLSTWEGFMLAEKYDQALKWAKEAEGSAKLAKDPVLVKCAADMWNEAFDAKKAFERAANATGAADADSSFALGFYACFFRNDWAKGIPLLASGSNLSLQELAKKEGLAVGDPDAQVDLSLAWASIAEREKDSGAKRRYHQRARYWKDLALKGATGLAKTKAAKKLLPTITIQKANLGTKGDVVKLLQEAIDARPGAPIVVDGYLAQDAKVPAGQSLVVEYSADNLKRRDVANVGESFFFPPMAASGSPLPSASFRFDLIAVYYGSGNTMVDCTDNARRVYRDPFAPLSGAIAGADTTPFRTKTLTVIADLYGRRFVRTLREGEVSQTLMR